MSDRTSTFMHLTLVAFLLVLYFGASPAAAARFAMCFSIGQATSHGVFWWVRSRGRV